MKRIVFIIGTFIALWTAVVFAEGEPFSEGKGFQRAPKEVLDNPTVQDFVKESRGKIQVIEFFSYGCTWCFKLDPYVDTWEKTVPSYATFQRIPVDFQPSWRPLSKAYYAAQDLRVADKIHVALFSAVQNEHITDVSEETLKNFFVQHGVSAQAFEKAYNSFDVDRRQKWANSMSQAYRIAAIPAFIVQGPTGVYVSTVRMAGSEDNLFKIVNHLIEQEHAALSGGQSKQ